MKKFLIICRETGQSTNFKRVILNYTKTNDIPIEWLFADDKKYLDIINNNEIQLVLISPEAILVEKEIMKELDSRNIKYISMEPIDFGLRRMEKIFPLLEGFYNE